MIWTDQYSALDRLLHRLAFAGAGVQKLVADIEDTVFASTFASTPCKRPIFITSLPRAGTTLLLELLSSLPSVATHTYRNMPFLLCPLLWDRMSRGFRRNGERRERAHDDGVMIDYDSAEAFEEALWCAWWPSKYKGGRVMLWSAVDADEDFATFFSNHLRKLVALRQQSTSPSAKRYLSKNNANIARLRYLVRLFPDCTIIVPVREPRAHVASLHRQHMRFLKIHSDDAFARSYMLGIGHFDFGANLAPITFPGFDGDVANARELAFWLDYWIAAYRMLASIELPQIVFLPYELLCAQPVEALERLLVHLDEQSGIDIPTLATRVRKPEAGTARMDGVAETRLTEADAIYRQLAKRSIMPGPNGRRVEAPVAAIG